MSFKIGTSNSPARYISRGPLSNENPDLDARYDPKGTPERSALDGDLRHSY